VILEELNTYDKNVAANDLKEYGDVYIPIEIIYISEKVGNPNRCNIFL